MTLVSFFGKKLGKNENKPTWVTSQEKNFNYFEITKSADAHHFETIGRMAPTQLTSALRSYEFVDNQANGMTYYRLKMVDNYGIFEFSKIISLDQDLAVSAIGSIYPNPAVTSTTAKIDIFAQKIGTWTLTTFNLEGKVIQAKQLQLKSGMNILTIDNLLSGINLIHLSDGSKMVVVRKIVKP